MPGKSIVFAAVATLWAVSACSYLPDVGLSDDEATITSSTEPALPEKVFVVRVENLELGRLYDGYMLTAIGIAPDIGYYEPELRLRYNGELGPDGFYEYDFVARAPDTVQGGATVPVTARYLRADSELTPLMLRSARGVRIWSARDSVEGRF